MPFQPSQTFVSKAGGYLSEAPFRCSIQGKDPTIHLAGKPCQGQTLKLIWIFVNYRRKKFYNINTWISKLVLVEVLTLQGPGSHIKGWPLNSGSVWQLGRWICQLCFGRQAGRTSVKFKTWLRVKMEIGWKSPLELTVMLLVTGSLCYQFNFLCHYCLIVEKCYIIWHFCMLAIKSSWAWTNFS